MIDIIETVLMVLACIVMAATILSVASMVGTLWEKEAKIAPKSADE